MLPIPSRDAVLVTDMQNVYLPGQPWGCASFHRSCGRIVSVLEAVGTMEEPPFLCFTRFVSDPDGTGAWAEYNAVYREINENPWMGELVDQLKPYAGIFPVYRKSVYSSMGIPEVRRAARQAERIVVSGVISECCVLSTCLEAVDMGCHVVYLRDACSGNNASTEQAVLRILTHLSPLHVTIMDSEEYLRTLQAVFKK